MTILDSTGATTKTRRPPRRSKNLPRRPRLSIGSPSLPRRPCYASRLCGSKALHRLSGQDMATLSFPLAPWTFLMIRSLDSLRIGARKRAPAL